MAKVECSQCPINDICTRARAGDVDLTEIMQVISSGVDKPVADIRENYSSTGLQVLECKQDCQNCAMRNIVRDKL